MSNEDPSNWSNSRKKYEADKKAYEKRQSQMEAAANATGSLNLKKTRTNSEKHRMALGLSETITRTNKQKQFIKALSKHPIANYRQHLASGETLTATEMKHRNKELKKIKIAKIKENHFGFLPHQRRNNNNNHKKTRNVGNRVRKILLKKEEKRQKKKRKERQNINKNQNELLETFGGRRKRGKTKRRKTKRKRFRHRRTRKRRKKH
jgi:hypothetical protein